MTSQVVKLNTQTKARLSPSTSVSNREQQRDQPDTVAGFVQNLRNIDINAYATRKSVAVGLLDIALLTANAAQLKYVMTVGETHSNYYTLLTLILLSLGLQVFQAILIVILAIVYDLNKLEEQRRADIINSILVGITVFTVVTNVIINVFDYRDTSIRVEKTLI